MTQPITTTNRQRSILCQSWCSKLREPSEAHGVGGHRRQVVPAAALAQPCMITTYLLPGCQGSQGAPSHLDCPLAGRLQDKLLRQLQLEHGGALPGSPVKCWPEPGCSCTHMEALREEKCRLFHSTGRAVAGAGLPADSMPTHSRTGWPGLLCILLFHKSCFGSTRGWQGALKDSASPWEGSLSRSLLWQASTAAGWEHSKRGTGFMFKTPGWAGICLSGHRLSSQPWCRQFKQKKKKKKGNTLWAVLIVMEQAGPTTESGSWQYIVGSKKKNTFPILVGNALAPAVLYSVPRYWFTHWQSSWGTFAPCFA